jgi:hypothetical protein
MAPHGDPLPPRGLAYWTPAYLPLPYRFVASNSKLSIASPSLAGTEAIARTASAGVNPHSRARTNGSVVLVKYARTDLSNSE